MLKREREWTGNMSKTVTMLSDNSNVDFALQDYIHILDENDGTCSIYINKNNQIKSYGKEKTFKAALKKAKTIQIRHRYLILHHDVNGWIIKIYHPKLNAINDGDNDKGERKIKRPSISRRLSPENV